MIEIVPAIIGHEFKELQTKIGLVEDLVKWVQIDVMDGLFASSYSWHNPVDLQTLDGKTKLEIHLMVEEPEHELAEWLKVADRILIHYESTQQLPKILETFTHSPVKFGLVLLLETPLEVLDQYAGKLEHIQLMGIREIGFHGHTLEAGVIERVRAVREKFKNVTIAVDGGVTFSNAEDLVAAGATHLVIGSAIWESGNVAKAIKQFQDLKS